MLVAALFAFSNAAPPGFLTASAGAGADGSHASGLLGGLVLSMFTFTGYDASAHLAEETRDPARRTAWGIVSSVAVSAVFGWLLLVALTRGMAAVPGAAGRDDAPLVIMRTLLGGTAGRAGMGLAVAAMWFCGLSSVTSASRTVFAFARDGGLPGSGAVGRVSPRTRTPLVAIGIVTLGPLVLVLATFVLAPSGSAASIFDAMAKTATMALYVSYAIPIFFGALARGKRRSWTRKGPFDLRGAGVPVAWAALAWCTFVLVVCALPPNQLPALLLGALAVILAIAWFSFVHRRFAGPKVSLANLES